MLSKALLRINIVLDAVAIFGRIQEDELQRLDSYCESKEIQGASVPVKKAFILQGQDFGVLRQAKGAGVLRKEAENSLHPRRSIRIRKSENL